MSFPNTSQINTCIVCGTTSSSHWVLGKTTCKRCYMKTYNRSAAGKKSHKKYLDSEEGKCKHEEWILANRPKVLKQKKKYRSSPKGKVARDKANRSTAYKSCKKTWNAKNRSLINSLAAKRRATKLKATPKWSDLVKIDNIYKNCPPGFHVDHIIPLQGKNVCGLHVDYNLQYLPALDNMKKGNRTHVIS